MPAITFLPGQTMVRPGFYVNIRSSTPPPTTIRGIVAALFAADWGPLTPVVLNGYDDVAATYGTTNKVGLAQQAFKGGAFQVLALRLGGASAAKAAVTLVDTTGSPVSILTITAKYVGTRGNGLTVKTRVNLGDATKRDMLIMEGTQILQQVTITHGSDDAGDFVAAFAAVPTQSIWVDVVKLATGNGIIAVVGAAALTGGVNPTVNAASYTTVTTGALALIEPLAWNVLATDTDDSTSHSLCLSLQAFVDRVRTGDGNRGMLVVAAPSALGATRITNLADFNDYAVVYVFNGFVTNDAAPVTLDGYLAGGRVAGMIAGTAVNQSLTHAVVADGATVTGAMTNSDYQAAILAGGFAFSMNALSQVQVEYGITTLTALPTGVDAGWKKIRRVRTRDYLVTQIGVVWDPMIGQVTNSTSGQGALIAAALGVIASMISLGALSSGTVVLDPANPPSGDSVWFVVTVTDLDSAEHFYGTFNFSF